MTVTMTLEFKSAADNVDVDYTICNFDGVSSADIEVFALKNSILNLTPNDI